MPRNTSGHRKPLNKKSKFTTDPMPTVSELPVSIGLANKLRELDHYLFREFGAGANFSYIIGGNGKILAASNEINGIVVPDVKIEISERIWSESEIWQMPEGTKIEHPLYGVGEIKRAYRVADGDKDDRVAVFDTTEFNLPAPSLEPKSPWDHKVKLTLPTGAEISTAFSTKA